MFYLSLHASAQKYHYRGIENFPVDSVSGKITYAAVVEVPGATQAELYRRAKEWLITNKRQLAKIELAETPYAGRIKGRVTLAKDGTPSSCTVTIETKEGRARYELTDFTTPRSKLEEPLESYIPATAGLNAKAFDMTFLDDHSYFADVAANLDTALRTAPRRW
ncbi:hypothetical protein [Hymenobacter koreensis]|uniref:hypothetical protein n=1 Tax=Hymenobacter koreensis TaxID=1084523 RepID=UPI0031E7209A